MKTDQIRFEDGAAYERYTGKWSQLAGHVFLDWLAAKGGLRWLDVGCGNGAFTDLGAPSVGGTLATMAPEDFATLKSRVQAHLPEDAAGRITYEVRANAMKGRTPM